MHIHENEIALWKYFLKVAIENNIFLRTQYLGKFPQISRSTGDTVIIYSSSQI